MSTKFKSAGEAWSYDYRSSNHHIEIKIRRNTAIAIFVSLLIHGVVLFAYYPKKFDGALPSASSSKILSVQLAGLPSKKADIKDKQKVPASKAIAEKNNTVIALPQPAIKTPLNPDSSVPKDFMSYIKAKRQRTQDLEDYAARENANARPPTTDELRDANIRQNLQQPGTSGIFEIRHKASNTAQFSFKGWKNDGSIPRMELIDVSVGEDGNIDLAVVKKMIEIIRREYKGNFNWESQRLGRVIVLSARIEDNSGLEEFLMREFFASPNY